MTTTSPINSNEVIEGILLVNKPKGKTSFSLVYELRKILGVKKIGHAGTLDPFATGVMVMLIGRNYTKLSDQFLGCEKEYVAEVHLGASTNTYDCEGEIVATSTSVPSLQDIQKTLEFFQGEIDQIPPMFSAKKIKGQKLYDLARKGIEVERQPVKVKVDVEFLNYNYPKLNLRVKCSKGTYIRSIAYDLGEKLGCHAHLTALVRTQSGKYQLNECVDGQLLREMGKELVNQLIQL